MHSCVVCACHCICMHARVCLFLYVCVFLRVHASADKSGRIFYTDKHYSCCHSLFTSLAPNNTHIPKTIGSVFYDNCFSSVRTINRQSEIQHGLLMLFNCNIKESFQGENVYNVLGDTALLWPSWLFYMKMVARCELAVPLTAGWSTANWSACMLPR